LSAAKRSAWIARAAATRAHLGASFRRRWQHEVGGGDRGNFDLQVDAVEQRP
jgi:hypothetical protein